MMAVFGYKIIFGDEKKLAELMAAREEAQTSYDHALEEAEYCRKVMREGEIAQAVAENNIAEATAKSDDKCAHK